ncbi:MAG: hypothetical protein ACRDHV_05150 [Actinomycetota bacterium]
MVRKLLRLLLPGLIVFGLAVGSLPAAADHNADLHSPNVQLLDTDPQTGTTNTDLAFWGNRLYAGDVQGFRIFDISNPANPTIVNDYNGCPGSQHDISVWNNDADPQADLLFLSVDTIRTNNTCASATATAAQQEAGWEGVRIFDINDEMNPMLIAAVPTDCGAHTHTMVPTVANDFLYLYVSSYPLSGQTNGFDFAAGGGTGGADKLAGQRINGTECLEPEPRPNNETGDWEANKVHNKISIIEVDLSDPAAADDAIVGPDCDGGGPATSCVAYPAVTEWPMPLGTRVTHLQLGNREISIVGCHDIAVFKELSLAAGSCFDETQLWDITNPKNPDFLRRARNNEVDLLFHSVTFSWDGTTLALEDEAGGGGDDRCRDPNDLQGRMWFYNTSLNLLGSFKIPRPQPVGETCTAHNYNIVPQTDGREILVSAWYRGGTSVIDMTNPAAATEIGFYDAQTDPGNSNAWSSYWYNGYIYVNDIGRGLDTIAVNDARVENAVTLPYLNPQTQMDVIDQNPPTCDGQAATMFGTSVADVLAGTAGADAIPSLGSDDIVSGLGGADSLCGGEGKDQLNGNGDNDRLFGEGDNDRLFGGPGRDRLVGGPGRDRLVGGPGKDVCIGGPGKDTAVGCEKVVKVEVVRGKKK